MTLREIKNAKGNEMKKEMTYSRACEILGLTSPKSVDENAKLAETYLSTLLPCAPLRYSVACMVLIRAAE